MIWRRRCRTMIADMPSLISISSRLISAGKARSSSLHGTSFNLFAPIFSRLNYAEYGQL
uniref:Cofilin/actin-depolymerizing factor-like protein n=1 Tax=Rhizophora mucronata TaxID=61149 RepID=A0A2P2JAZ4_RHIMU